MSGDAALVPAGPKPDKGRLPAPRLDLLPNRIEKAAIILTAIGPEFAANCLRNLNELDMQRLVGAIARLGKVGQEVLDAVIFEFLEQLMAGPEVAGGADAVRKLLAGILDANQLDQLLSGMGRGQFRTVWERLNDTSVVAVVGLLQSEHPQTAAVIISEMRAESAAKVLERLDRKFAQTIVLRLSRVPTLDAQVSAIIRDTIDRDFLSVLQRNLSKRRPAELIAALMNNLSTEARDVFLANLEAKDPDIAQEVVRTMFTFDDIAARVHARDIAGVLRDMDEETLLKAIKHGQAQGSATVTFIMRNLARRLSERYAEDLAAMDDVGNKEGEAAQIEMTKIILTQVKARVIKLIDTEDASG